MSVNNKGCEFTQQKTVDKLTMQIYALAPRFRSRRVQNAAGAAQNYKQWAELKAALDELGPHKSVEQWKVCWRDQKRRARAEGGAFNKANNSTGNSVEIPNLSENSIIILDTIGQEMAVGCGPEDSPIGFNDPASIVMPTLPTLNLQPSPPPSSATIKPSSSTPRPPPARRMRRTNPSDRFISAQLELNNLIKKLIK